MFSDLKASFFDVFDKKIRPLMLKIVLAAAGVWAVSLYVFWRLLGLVEVSESAWIAKSVQILGFLGVFIGSLFFLPVLMSVIAGLFTDSMVRALSAQGKNLTFKAPSTTQSLKISGVAAFKSLLAGTVFFPLTLLLGIFPILNLAPPAAYCYVNGRVFAYEYFFSTALCLMTEDRAQAMYDAHRANLNKAGMLIALLMMLPVVNIFAPLIASAFMQKQIARLAQKEEQ